MRAGNPGLLLDQLARVFHEAARGGDEVERHERDGGAVLLEDEHLGEQRVVRPFGAAGGVVAGHRTALRRRDVNRRGARGQRPGDRGECEAECEREHDEKAHGCIRWVCSAVRYLSLIGLAFSAVGNSFGSAIVTLPVAAHSVPRVIVPAKPQHFIAVASWPIGVWNTRPLP